MLEIYFQEGYVEVWDNGEPLQAIADEKWRFAFFTSMSSRIGESFGISLSCRKIQAKLLICTSLR
jgi:hypothetical protein